MPGGVLDTVDRDIFLQLVLLDTSVQSSNQRIPNYMFMGRQRL